MSDVGFANVLAGDNAPMMNDCEIYGMAYGCDTECPVLQAGKCENDENKELYQKYLSQTKAS